MTFFHFRLMPSGSLCLCLSRQEESRFQRKPSVVNYASVVPESINYEIIYEPDFLLKIQS